VTVRVIRWPGVVKSGVEKMVDGVTAGEVRLEIGNYRLFSNATTVLPLSGIVEGDTGAFAGPRVHPLIGNWFPKRQESQDRRIIPVYRISIHAPDLDYVIWALS
jgi:hypothetical protein